MYAMKISTACPGLIVLVLDDSGSTQEVFPGTTDPIFKWIERYSGVILKNLLVLSTEVQGENAKVKPRYHILIIKYGSKPEIWGDGIMDIDTVVQRYTEAKNSFGLGGHLGGTDTKAAFETAYDELKKAVHDPTFKESFPPMVFHLTDGLSNTDATTIADALKQLATSDGNALVVNSFIGTQTNLSYQGPDDFTGYLHDSEAGDEDNVRLFKMSSVMPKCIHQNLIDDAIFPNLREDSHLFFDVRTKDMLKHTIQAIGSIGSRANRSER